MKTASAAEQDEPTDRTRWSRHKKDHQAGDIMAAGREIPLNLCDKWPQNTAILSSGSSFGLKYAENEPLSQCTDYQCVTPDQPFRDAQRTAPAAAKLSSAGSKAILRAAKRIAPGGQEVSSVPATRGFRTAKRGLPGGADGTSRTAKAHFNAQNVSFPIAEKDPSAAPPSSPGAHYSGHEVPVFSEFG